jgi:stalled ribosome rescue protein Dom34
MSKSKQLGIFLDHASANLLSLDGALISKSTINSKFTQQVKVDSLSKGENLMHDKEQQQQKQYYHTIADFIKNYNDVLVFGPTDAKLELVNILKNDNHFLNIRIIVKTTDKLDDSQQDIYVRNHFSTSNKLVS